MKHGRPVSCYDGGSMGGVFHAGPTPRYDPNFYGWRREHASRVWQAMQAVGMVVEIVDACRCEVKKANVQLDEILAGLKSR